MTKIPSFVFGVTPTDADLQACIDAGMIPRSVTVFSGKKAYESVPSLPLPPTSGPPQWWQQTSSNPGIGYFRLTGKVHKAGQMSLAENQMYSSAARQFYAERPNLDVPEWELVLGQGWGQLSFARSASLPAEYPFGEIRSWGVNAQEHYFPTDCVTFMLDGAPCFERITQAIERFKLTPQMPTGPGAASSGGGYTADDVVAAALTVADFATAPDARAILNSNESNAVKAGKLVKL